MLSGGGAKGSFQVGVLKYLYETEGFFPDILVGVSVGAINAFKKLAEAPFFPTHAPADDQHRLRFEELEAFWRTLRDNRQVYEARPELAQIENVDALRRPQGPRRHWLRALGNAAILGPAALPILLGFGIAAAMEVDEIEAEINRKLKLIDALRKKGSIYTVDALVENFLKKHVKLEWVRSRGPISSRRGRFVSGAVRWFDKTDPDLVSAVRASSDAGLLPAGAP